MCRECERICVEDCEEKVRVDYKNKHYKMWENLQKNDNKNQKEFLKNITIK